MTLVLKELGYKIVPHRDGLCYELYKWKPERYVRSGRWAGYTSLARWVSLGFYPRDIAQGLHKILDLAVNADPIVLNSVREAADRIDAMGDSILKAQWADPQAV